MLALVKSFPLFWCQSSSSARFLKNDEGVDDKEVARMLKGATGEELETLDVSHRRDENFINLWLLMPWRIVVIPVRLRNDAHSIIFRFVTKELVFMIEG